MYPPHRLILTHMYKVVFYTQIILKKEEVNMSGQTLDAIMKNVPVLEFKYLKIGDEFIVAPISGEEMNSEKPFHVFKKIKKHKMGKLHENNAERRIDGVPSHIPGNILVVLLKNIPKEIVIK